MDWTSSPLALNNVAPLIRCLLARYLHPAGAVDESQRDVGGARRWLTNNARDDSNAVPKQARIVWLEHVCLHDGAIGPDLVAVLDALLAGETDD